MAFSDFSTREQGLTVWGICPNRRGSQRLPGKALRPLAGKPLLAYTLEAMRECTLLNKRWVYSNDPDVLAFARSYPQIDLPPFPRPEHVSDATATTEATLGEFLKNFAVSQLPDVLVVLQPTSPMRTPADIEQAIRQFVEEGGLDPGSRLDFLLSVCPPYKPLDWHLQYSGDKKLLMPVFAKTPSSPEGSVCLPNGALWVTRPQWLMQGGGLSVEGLSSSQAPRCIPYWMPWQRSVDVDTEDDLAWAEFLISRTGALKEVIRT